MCLLKQAVLQTRQPQQNLRDITKGSVFADISPMLVTTP